MDAPLYLDVADAPKDGRAYWAQTSDGVRIRFGVWPGAKGYVLIYPGRTEYIEKYGRVISRLNERGLGCIILDWRNQGLSDRAALTGHVGHYDEYQNDIEAVLATNIVQNLKRPFHLLSHSMGGLIALGSLKRELNPSSAIFSAPMWGMGMIGPVRSILKSMAVAATVSGLGTKLVLGSLRGSYIKTADPHNNVLMSDPKTAEWIQLQLKRYPKLALGGPSWAWLKASHQEIEALRGYDVPNLPTLTLLGTEESVVNPEAVLKRMASSSNGRLLMCHGAKHEVLMEKTDIQVGVWAAMDEVWGTKSVQEFKSSTA